jgi:hypothetical protein
VRIRAIRTASAARLLALVLLLPLPTVVQAQFTFATNNGALAITGYTGLGGAVVVPDTTNGMLVTSIGDDAFNGQMSLTSVTIPNGVTNIGNCAFLSCGGLTNIALPDSLASIGSTAFYFCTSLTGVTIPKSVVSVGRGAFNFCQNLKAITVDTQNTNYCSADGVLFDKGETTLVQCPAGKFGSYTIPGSVVSIGVDAFFRAR